jgi:hypothetical protein
VILFYVCQTFLCYGERCVTTNHVCVVSYIFPESPSWKHIEKVNKYEKKYKMYGYVTFVLGSLHDVGFI